MVGAAMSYTGVSGRVGGRVPCGEGRGRARAVLGSPASTPEPGHCLSSLAVTKWRRWPVSSGSCPLSLGASVLCVGTLASRLLAAGGVGLCRPFPSVLCALLPSQHGRPKSRVCGRWVLVGPWPSRATRGPLSSPLLSPGQAVTAALDPCYSTGWSHPSPRSCPRPVLLCPRLRRPRPTPHPPPPLSLPSPPQRIPATCQPACSPRLVLATNVSASTILLFWEAGD